MAVIKNYKTGMCEVRTYYKDLTGARKQKTKRGFAKKGEALEWERNFKLKEDQSISMSFKSFVDIYLTDLGPRIKRNTFLTKKHIIETKILPYFGKRKLDVADLGRMDINHKTDPEIAVKDGHVYVQAPSLQPAHILNDTLYLISCNQLAITEDYAKILPLQIGARFLVSTHYDPTLPERSYTFCYDRQKTKAYNVQGGLDDNFYKTGKVPELQSIDLQSNTYCYYKSGEELANSFPDRTNKGNPVLFIVKMKA